MLDARLRPLIDPFLNRLGRWIAHQGLNANQLTYAGMVIGVMAGLAIAGQWYLPGLILICINRLLDGLDGAVARATEKTDFGGYLDIVADFVFYVAVPIGFGFAHPQNMPFALLLVASFTLTGISFLAFATLAEKHGMATQDHGEKSFFYNTGLAEGTETILCFILMCLFPTWFPALAFIYTIICLVTVVQRSLYARRLF